MTFILPKLPSFSWYSWSYFFIDILFLLFFFFIRKFHLTAIFKQNKKYTKLGLFTFLVYLPWIGVVVILSLLIILDILGYPSFESASKISQGSVEWDTPIFFATAITTSLIAPIFEEIIFRGIFQNCSTKWLGPLFGIVATSLLFSVLHAKFGYGISNFDIIVRTFVFSLFCGYLYFKTKSLYSCFAFHITNNTLYLLPLILEKLEVIQPL